MEQHRGDDTRKKILCVTDEAVPESKQDFRPPSHCKFVNVAVSKFDDVVGQVDFDALIWLADRVDARRQYWHLTKNAVILDQMPVGLALVDKANNIIWANQRLASWFEKDQIVGLNFFDAMNNPEIMDGSRTPLKNALKTGKPCVATLKIDEARYLRVRAAPLVHEKNEATQNVVTISDISRETLHLQKLEAIHAAGAELADLLPEEIFQMNVEERIELVKANILHHTQGVLNFDVVEIRLIDRKTNECKTLLSEGMDAGVEVHNLFAHRTGNGVTGFVCATAKSYLCEDTTNDPLYVDGLLGAKSSLTVPLMLHEEVIGSFNVESPEIGAFTETDLQLLQIFSRDIARALNSLDLLVAQKHESAQQSVEAIDIASAKPIDEILNDAVQIIESYAGDDPDVTRRLHKILKNSRDIKHIIHGVRENSCSNEALPESVQTNSRPLLRGCRVLVVDSTEEIRDSAHLLLEKYGCIVETAHEGREALMMVRNCEPESAYDVIIADIRLPDLSGFDILVALQKIYKDPPLVLMAGFGYDPGHSIVKARQAGLQPHALLFKPFKIEQMLETLEKMMGVGEDTGITG